jgi:hypothetical protein
MVQGANGQFYYTDGGRDSPVEDNHGGMLRSSSAASGINATKHNRMAK